ISLRFAGAASGSCLAPRAKLGPRAESMFDIGWSELLVIGVVAIVVVGPKELPRLMRAFGTYTGRARLMAADFQRQFEDAVRDSELDEVRKAMHEFRAEASSMVGLHNPID